MKSTETVQKQDNSYKSMRVDFHSHTTCSDGHLKPSELIDRASNYQIEQFAITDHDTMAGYTLAQQYITEKKLPIRLISGIEISTLWQNFEIHIVGLNMDVNHPALINLISAQQQAREDRAQTMASKLHKAGFEGCYEQAKEYAQDGTITRAHFARVLLDRGLVSNLQKAFDKYIGKGQRCYVKPLWCSVEEAVKVIAASGGYSVIAHPMKYGLSTKWLRRLIVDFCDAGGHAMEATSAQMNDQQRQLSLALCQEYSLLASVGSDFHYPSRWSDLGKNLTLPDHVDVVWQHWNEK